MLEVRMCVWFVHSQKEQTENTRPIKRRLRNAQRQRRYVFSVQSCHIVVMSHHGYVKCILYLYAWLKKIATQSSKRRKPNRQRNHWRVRKIHRWHVRNSQHLGVFITRNIMFRCNDVCSATSSHIRGGSGWLLQYKLFSTPGSSLSKTPLLMSANEIPH